MRNVVSYWTDERVEELKRLHADGGSAAQIAAMMKAPSRNAVIGKLLRLGITGEMRPAKKWPQQRQARRPRRTGQHTITNIRNRPDPRTLPSPSLPAEPPPVPDMKRVSLLELTDQMCKWPVGDPRDKDFCFCGTEPYNGLPYCGYHARVAYVPVRERKRIDRYYLPRGVIA